MNELSIPAGDNIESLADRKRREYPRLYRMNDISWNSAQTKFLLAYTVDEISMGNYVGNICFGKMIEEKAEIIWNPEDIHISCSANSWCNWIDENTVVFKTQKYAPDRIAAYGGHTHVPLICINTRGERTVLEGTNNLKSRPTDCTQTVLGMEAFTDDELVEKILSCS